MAPLAPARRSDLALLAGAMLAAYGALVLLGILAHESPVLGVALLLGGAALAWWARPLATTAGAPEVAPRGMYRALTVVVGLVAFAGIPLYNAAARSSWSAPEVAIVAYGGALVAAAVAWDRKALGVTVPTMVAWSLPLAGGPLGLWALDAAIEGLSRGPSPLDGVIATAMVQPMAWALNALGLGATSTGQTVHLATPRGSLALSVGLVCAGLHPGVLFLGLLGLHAWRTRLPPRRLAGLMLAGLVGVYLVNLIRLVLLALVGREWGGEALQQAHANAGWVLFLLFLVVFWRFAIDRPAADGKPQMVL